MPSSPIRVASVLITLAMLAACSSSTPTGDDGEPQDFLLTVQFGSDVVRDNGPEDGDPELNRIALEGYRPDSYEGRLLVNNLLIHAQPDGSSTLTVASTSTVSATDEEPALMAMSGDGPDPFEEILVVVTADVSDFFPSGTERFSGTVHLHGSYLAVDDAGAPRDGEPISHARIRLTGDATTEGGTAEPLGTVEGGLAEGEASPVPFDPSDVTEQLTGIGPSTLRQQIFLELGPSAAATFPVSAEVTLEARP